MTETNDLFKKSVEMLNYNNINYWVCHGTLLGIIRDKILLTWDHDIDFAVWEDEHSKEDILKIFSLNKGFKQEISLEEVNSLHFETIDKRIDINFYTRDKDKSFIKWAVPSEEIFKKFLTLYTIPVCYTRCHSRVLSHRMQRAQSKEQPTTEEQQPTEAES